MKISKQEKKQVKQEYKKYSKSLRKLKSNGIKEVTFDLKTDSFRKPNELDKMLKNVQSIASAKRDMTWSYYEDIGKVRKAKAAKIAWAKPLKKEREKKVKKEVKERYKKDVESGLIAKGKVLDLRIKRDIESRLGNQEKAREYHIKQNEITSKKYEKIK